MNILESELIKYRRTLVQKFTVLSPLFFVLQASLQKLFMPANYFRPWQLITSLVFNWWPVIFLPLGLALLAVLVDSQERKAGDYRGLRCHNISPAYIWTSKVAAMAIYTLVATAVLLVSTVMAGLITAKGGVPWGKIISACLVLWVASLPLIPIQLWAATWKGMFSSMAVGFAGMMTGVFAAQKYYWFVDPWSWGTRMMCPIIGVHPNGTLLLNSSPLWNPSVLLAGLILSLAAFIVITLVTARWFSRREVR